MSGRTLAIGDVHGCYRALTRMVEDLQITRQDTVILLGDLVDHGPGSREVLDYLLLLRENCQLICLMGNHDEMMRNAISGRGPVQAWRDAGGQATLKSYGGSFEHVPPEHIRFLLELRPYHETDRAIFVHASLEPEVSLRNQTADYLRWKKLGGSEKPHPSGKRVICGHTSQKDGAPLVLDGWVCLDTYAYGGQWLTCLDLESDQVHQTSEDGRQRDFPLSRFA